MTLPKWVEEIIAPGHEDCNCDTSKLIKALTAAIEALEKMAIGLRYDDKIPKKALAEIEKMGDK